jgi:hypothetical protein
MDFYSDDSDPDLDADLQEDLDALRRSCILSGADPDAAVAAASSSYLTGPSTPAASASVASAAHDSSDDEEDEDLALVRSIRESLRLTRASPRPICVWPPSDTDDDDEDDLETLRAIQRRFSHYRSGQCSPAISVPRSPLIINSLLHTKPNSRNASVVFDLGGNYCSHNQQTSLTLLIHLIQAPPLHRPRT